MLTMECNSKIWVSLSVLFLFGIVTTPSFANTTDETRVLQAVQVNKAPILDGVLDDVVWENVPRTEPFKQKDPIEGEDSSEITYAKVIYTEEILFVGIMCLDSSPEKIVATELRRDGDLKKDDSIWILIDSFHDHRNAFLFATNAQGTQYDALVIDEGKETNKNWDEAWDVVAHRNENGWSVEFAIPSKILRLRASSEGIGLEFQRLIRRKNEFVYWNTWERDFRFEEVSQAGHLVGLQSTTMVNPWRLKGYVVGGFGEKGTAGWDNRSDVGIEDLKWRVTPALTVDMTLRTDFGEVDVDAQQSNFSTPRRQLFFPEKREFFQEGAGFFDFSARMEEGIRSSTFQAFFSRRIGLAQDGKRVPILGGGKLTGKIKSLALGVLNVQTRADEDFVSTNYSVVRLRQDLFERSSIGGIITNQSDGATYNRTAGIDGRFLLFDNLTLEGFLMRSAEPHVRENQDAYHIKGYWQSDLWMIGAGHLTVEPDFNPAMGFVGRHDVRKTIGDVSYKPRPNISWIRQMELRGFYEYLTNPENKVEQKVGHYIVRFMFERGDAIRIALHSRYNRLFTPLQLAPGVEIAPGDYDGGQNLSFSYFMDPGSQVSGYVRYGFQNDYFGAEWRNYWRIAPQWKPTASWIFDLDYNIETIRFSDQKISSHVVNLGANYAFNTRVLTSTILQYNNLQEIKGINFRLNYIYRPGDDLIFVYRDMRNGLRPEFNDRAFLVKYTRSFDF